VSRSQSQRVSVDEFELVEHNERVLEMYKWLTSSESWSEIKKTLEIWVENESDSEDTENFMELALDIINLVLYCGGVRVFKLEDIEDLDLDALSTKERKELVQKLEKALEVDHEDIEEIADNAESDDEDERVKEDGNNSEDEKAEEAESKTKKNKNKKNKKKAARSRAEKVLCYDPMLWINGTTKEQKSMESRYKQLMEKIGGVFEGVIFDGDDYIISCILSWCQFLCRSFELTQFRRLGTLTAFSLCDPLIRCMAKNRKTMEKLKECLERERTLNLQRATKRKKKEEIERNGENEEIEGKHRRI